jgi:hypothetical protein
MVQHLGRLGFLASYFASLGLAVAYDAGKMAKLYVNAIKRAGP